MIDWTKLPWTEMLLSSTYLLGILAILQFLVSKYPSSRSLGKFLASTLIFAISLKYSQEYFFKNLMLVILSIAFYHYTLSFFLQKTRVNLKHIIPIVIATICVFIPEKFALVPLVKLIYGTIVIGYLIASVSFIKKEGRLRGISWFFNPGSRLTWFRNFISFNFSLILYILVFIHRIGIVEMTFLVLIQLLFVYFQIFKESGFLSPIPLGNKYQKSTLTPNQKSAILNKLELMISNDKFYLNDNVSLRNLAESLHTTTHHLSQVLNESKGVSFQELISQHRIKEAKLLLKDKNQQQTKIENIAAMVGYNSKSAFNIAFKRHTGLTPTSYKKTKGVVTYREDPLPERKHSSITDNRFSSYHVLLTKINYLMVNNFLKIFYRTLMRNKVFSAINLFGLTVGFCCSIFIYLFISYELSYDKSLPNNERIYRIGWINENPQTRTPHPMAQAMVRDMPEVEAAVSISPWYGSGLSKQTQKVKNIKTNVIFDEPDFYFADSTFLDVFDLEVIAGDKDALKKPWNLVITEELATKYFGAENPIGQELSVADMTVEVAAVVKGLPSNSHFHFSALISYVTLKSIGPENPWYKWGDFGHFNYIKIKPGVDYKALEAKITNWVIPYLDWKTHQIESFKAGNQKFELQPITDIHLNSHLRWELENNGNILYVYILSGALLFILLIVSINYINLTTAKSTERAKEVGIRKTLGAVSYNLTAQFYLESIIFCFLALFIALGLSTLLLEAFNNLANQSFTIEDIYDASLLIKACILCLIIALGSALYPALILSKFIPTEVLKGKFSSSKHGSRLRGVLVVVQFFVSTILIAGCLIIIKQIDYMKSKDLGFNQEAIISIQVFSSAKIGGIDIAMVKELQNQFRKIAGVKKTSTISNLPGQQFNQNPIIVDLAPDEDTEVSELYVDFDFMDVFDMQLIEGRNFEKSYSTDSSGSSFILNESAVKSLNLKNPIGKGITWDNDWQVQKGNVIGVVKDFHFKSLHETIQPLIIKISPYDINYVIVKMEGENFQQTLAEMEKIYSQFEKELPFEYHFLDQQLAELYNNDIRVLNIFSLFAVIALILACLGLFGLAMAILNQKTKEVGIRKILGASSKQIAIMIFTQFSGLIFIALIFGLPISYFLMQKWISEFSYQVILGFMPFVVASIILFAVAILSVSMIVLKIANSNPVKSLRYE